MSCCGLKGLQGRNPGLRGRGGRLERGLRSGEGGLGVITEEKALLGDGSQGERRLSGGSRGEDAKML